MDVLYWRNIAGNTIAETDSTGSTINASYHEYIFFAGRRVARSDVSAAQVYYYFVDHLGSTRIMTQANGTVCFNADYFPYGQEIDFITPSCNTTYKFTGYERDGETGLDYAFARYYNDRLGRFMSGDPLGGDTSDPQTLNRYAYARNNPVNLTDPTGMESSGGGPNPFENIEPCFTGCYGGDWYRAGGGAHSPILDFWNCVRDSGEPREEAMADCGKPSPPQAQPPQIPSQPAPPPSVPTPQPQNPCAPSVLRAVNQEFGPGSYSMSDPFPNGGATNFIVSATGLPATQFNSIQPGRYPLNWWSYVVGYGPTLHVTGQTWLNPPPAIFSNANIAGVTAVQFTAHTDSAFAYNPIGALIHLFADVLHVFGSRNQCP